MNIRRKLLIAALALGTVVGFGSEFMHWRVHGHGRRALDAACADAVRRNAQP